MTAAKQRAEAAYVAAEREAIEASSCTLAEWLAMGRDAAKWLGMKEGSDET
jgi:hypothetical protein